jgi:hypothetical protein
MFLEQTKAPVYFYLKFRQGRERETKRLETGKEPKGKIAAMGAREVSAFGFAL